MKIFLGCEGKETIKDAIVRTIEEISLESGDIVYFDVSKESDFDALVKEVELNFISSTKSVD